MTIVGWALAAHAGRVPISFDGGLAANPVSTQSKLTTLDSKLPASFALPPTMTTLTSRQVTLTVFPETSAALQRAGASGPGTMVFPTPTVWCPKHVAFTVPATLLVASPGAGCAAAETSLRQQLASASACREVEQPERYALNAAPAVVNNTTTATIESLIGLAGEALSHSTVPAGLLTPEWMPTLRSIVWKLREPVVTAQVTAARAAYSQASSLLSTQASCFEPAARMALVTQVGELDVELAALGAHVTAVIADGTAQASQDLACLSSRARSRPALPFPTLTDAERKFVAFWLGGTYWRMRGGGLLPLGSTQNARTYFCERPFRRIGELAGGAVGEQIGYQMYLNIFDGWGEWMDMGTTAGGQDLYEDLVQMTDRGRHQVADGPLLGTQSSAVKYLTDHGYDPTALYAGGMDMGPCYLYGLDPLSGFRYADQLQAPYGPFIEAFTAVGEFCTGASIGLGMATALLDGTPSGQPPLNLCAGKQCGADGCGGSCGTCAGTNVCSATGQCPSAPVADAGAATDAGVATDAGATTDAGTPDAGVMDAGPAADAGEALDAGPAVSSTDAGHVDAGAPDAGSLAETPMAAGCGCGATPPGIGVLFALLAFVRRRADWRDRI